MADQNRIFASPLARRVAGQKGVDLADISGTGPRGRIILKDVEGFTPNVAVAAAPSGEVERIKLDGMRKTVAKRMVEAKSTVPHFYLTVDVQLDNLLAARSQVNECGEVKVSVNDFIIKASAYALMKQSDANVTWGGDAILRHPTADISVAVAMDGGLITPVLRGCEAKGLQQIATEMKDLATRARDRKLKPEEYQGGSFSISNLGMFGVKEFSAVINPPQGMILAVGAGERRPIVLADDSLGVATVMSVTLSCDHRSVDGALGAQWLQHFKAAIEQPVLMLA